MHPLLLPVPLNEHLPTQTSFHLPEAYRVLVEMDNTEYPVDLTDYSLHLYHQGQVLQLHHMQELYFLHNIVPDPSEYNMYDRIVLPDL